MPSGLAVVRENIRPNVKPKKSNSPSGTVQICVLSSFTVSFSLPMISRRWCSASSALALSAQDHKIIRIGNEASAEAVLKAELLPPQHKPAHVDVSPVVVRGVNPAECRAALSRASVVRVFRPRSSVFFDGAVQPHLDQMQHAPINDTARHRL